MLKNKLFKRMSPKLPGVYGFAGFILFMLGLFGFQYGAAILFWPLAAICFSLIVYPTLFCWGLITGSFTLASFVYIGFTVIELTTKGKDSTIFSDGILVYIILISIIMLIALGLFKAKPTTVNNKNSR